MAKTKEQKEKIVKDLKEKIGQQKSMVFVDYQGVKTKELSSLRKRLKKADAMLRIAKKTLLGLASKEKKMELKKERTKGQLAIIFGFKDELAPAKIIYQFSRDFPNLKILGGWFEEQFRSAEEVIELAQLPTKQELLGQLVSALSAPVSGFLNVLQGNIRKLIYVLNAIKVKNF